MSILPQLFVNSLITGSLYALVSVGLALTYCTFRVLNFAHGHLLMLGAYLFYSWRIIYGFDPSLSFLLAILCIPPISYAILRWFIIPFLNGNPLLGLISTLALSIMIESVVSMVYGVNVKSLSTGMFEPPLEIFDVRITQIQCVIIATSVLLLVGIATIFRVSPYGRRLRALFESSAHVQAIGIDTVVLGSSVTLLSIGLAFLAGIFLGFETNIQPTMGGSIMIKGFAAMILGGLGSLWGALAGAFILALIENFSIGLDFGSYSLPAGYKDAFAFAVILLMLLCKPEGLFQKKRRAL